MHVAVNVPCLPSIGMHRCRYSIHGAASQTFSQNGADGEVTTGRLTRHLHGLEERIRLTLELSGRCNKIAPCPLRRRGSHRDDMRCLSRGPRRPPSLEVLWYVLVQGCAERRGYSSAHLQNIE